MGLYTQIFEPASYPGLDRLLAWGNVHLETLLDHYGQQKMNSEGVRFDPLVDPDRCREEFLPFKRAVARNLGEDQVHRYRPTELFQHMFSLIDGQGQRQIFPGV